MTENEEATALKYRKMEAEIAKLMAETSRINAEIPKLNAEAAKAITESRWYPLAAGAAIFAAGIGFLKLIS